MSGLEAFLASEAGLALKGAVIAAFADFATGTFAAIKDETFSADAIAAFLRKHILGRVAPLGTLLALGYFGGAAGAVFLPFAIAGLGLYAAETIASVKGNLNPPKASGVKDNTAAAALNPVPEE
jgi:hypothetical protein